MTAPPVFQASSGLVGDVGAFPLVPPISQKNDIALLYLQNANQNAFLSVAAGFSLIPTTGLGNGSLGATVSYVASAAPNEVNPTTGCTITIPTVVSGDDLCLSLTSRSHTSGTPFPTVTDNDGGTWTREKESTNRQAMLWHRKATGATSAKTITVAGCVGQTSASLDVYRGGDPTTPLFFPATAVEDNNSGDTSHAGFTPPSADCMICLSIFHVGDDHTVTGEECTNPGDLTERMEHVNTGCATVHASAKQSGGPTATGIFLWTPDSAGTSRSIVWAIKPASSNPATKLAIFWSRFGSSSPPTPWIGDSGDHQFAVMLTFRNCLAKGIPWSVVGAPQAASSGTAVSIPGVTDTLFNNCLWVAACAHALDSASAQFSAWANADLTGVTEIFDGGTTAGAGGGIGVATGVKALKGAVGATTATLASASIQVRQGLALRPFVPAAGSDTFLTITDPGDNSAITLRVAQFREEPPQYLGSLRPAFDGTPLSSLRAPRKHYTATVDFLTPGDYEGFLAFISSGTDPITGRETGIRPMLMVSSTTGSRRGKEPLEVWIEVGQATPFPPSEYQNTPGWTVDLTFREA